MKIRAAKSSDRDEILAFCKTTFSWGDYIDRVWGAWLAGRNGRLLVAEVEEEKVGLAHVAVCPGGKSAWLEGVRVRPDFRRSNIATALLGRMLAFAGKRGARQASAIVAQDNTASQRLLEKSGFSAVSRWVYYSIEPSPAVTSARLAARSDLAGTWRYLKNSHTYKQSAGRYVEQWHWYPLDKKVLERLVGEKRVVVTGDPVDGLAIINSSGYWDKPDVLQVTYLDSRKPGDLVAFAANLYAQGRFSRFHVLCHQSRHLTSFLGRFAAEESEQFLLYSKKVFTP
jgi:ribosomal protein S18 acetylase RimI-like enzyme